ncbi:cytochrome P450 2D6-like [Liolophura sinensis]|uniref:cytochrome P450 2D6-like n=1 Tax=Liolophura sinensis TaxID=3198878 RepID=UPI003159749A
MTLFPFLRHLPFGYGRLYRDHKRAFERYLYFMFEIPKERFDSESSGGCVNELLRLQSESPWLKDDNIRGIVREIVSAGLGTTSISVLAFFLILLHRPDVMKKIQQEIDAVIGRERPPRLTDKGHMPYTEAATLESLRYYTVLPLGVVHTTTREAQFRDYFIPKHTVIFTNSWLAHHDEAVWGDPWEYRPERFLDENGRLLPADSELMKSWFPFGTGKRACFGEPFARCRIFLFITTLLQHFNFRPCADEPCPSYDPRTFQSNITLIAPKFKVCAFPRN